MHLERELKFAVSARGAARALKLLKAARRERLETIYYDTADWRLHRAGAALRVRRQGRRWLQTLKVQRSAQGALAERSEYEVRVPRGGLEIARFHSIPINLAPLRLRAVFATRFRRTSGVLALRGGGRALLCVDQGAVEAGRRRQPIREVEVELQSGKLGELLRLAEKLVEPLGLRIETRSKAERGYRLAAGHEARPLKWSAPRIAPDASAAEALAALLSAALEQIAANAPHVGEDPEFLHQARVGIRRLRSALRAFRRLIHGRRAVERPFKRAMKILGMARDLDVFCATLAAGSLATRSQRRRERAVEDARAVLQGAEFQTAQLRFLRWLHRRPVKKDVPLADFARRALPRLRANLARRARGIDWRKAGPRHRVRIAVKRLRYACDFFSPCFPASAVQPYIAGLAALQDTLGELTDIAVARKLLQEVGPDRGLRRALDRRERELIAELGPAWTTFRRRKGFWSARGRTLPEPAT